MQSEQLIRNIRIRLHEKLHTQLRVCDYACTDALYRVYFAL